MATETAAGSSNKAPRTTAELIALVRDELEADGERQAKASAATAGELPRESQTGITLDLSRSNISILPEEVLVLIKDRVERLALSHNSHIVLPDSIGQCDRLRYLNMRWNKLVRFPEAVLNLPKLEILDVSKNAIESIPEDIRKMTNLKFLTIARNRITRLPLALGEMNLVKLKFDENPIEFPPAEALQASKEKSMSMPESERDKEMCQQVKKYMKTAALKELREKLRTNSEEDLSESNVETPKAPKRIPTGGRFPVRPSISSMDAIEPQLDSQSDAPPPIPARSHARGSSSKTSFSQHTLRWPGNAPILTNGRDVSRTRSETVGPSASLRTRRKGYMLDKNDGNHAPLTRYAQSILRHSNASTITPGHSRAPSEASALGRLMTLPNGVDSSSEAASPIDGRHGRPFSRRPSYLSRHRKASASSVCWKAVVRATHILRNLERSISDFTKQLRPSSPNRLALERRLVTIIAKANELDHMLQETSVGGTSVEDLSDEVPSSLVRTTLSAVRSFQALIQELKRVRPLNVDPFHFRNVMITAYHTSIEAQNVCQSLVQSSSAGIRKAAPTPPRPATNHTITPSSLRSAASRRRGTTVVPSAPSFTNLRSIVPPVTLNNGSSRSNTMTSLSGTTLTSVNGALPASMVPSRTNTMRSYSREPLESSDALYAKVKRLCKIADSILPHVRDELDARQTDHVSISQSRQTNAYGQALSMCDVVMTRLEKVHARLKMTRPSDLVRSQAELGQTLTELLFDWTRFAESIKDVVRQRLDIGTIRLELKPIHHAIQDMRNSIQTSAHGGGPGFGFAVTAAEPALTITQNGTSMYLNTAYGPSSGLSTPLPATPALAALGPAAQATVPGTPSGMYTPGEYFNLPVPSRNRLGQDRSHDRNDTVMQATTLPVTSTTTRR